MDIEVSDWVSIAAFATSFIAYLEAKKSNKTTESISALKDVLDASEKTQIYLVKRNDGADRDRESEIIISHLWSKAAASVSRVNEELSIRLHRKSEFWHSPDTWESALRTEIDISLESVTNDARSLLVAYA